MMNSYNILTLPPVTQITILAIVLAIFIGSKVLIKKKKPSDADFFKSTINCLSIYSIFVIIQLPSQVEGGGNEIIIPIFLAFAVQLWMTFSSIYSFYADD
ncbi:hypothetical protein R7E51_08660 [Vibrio sp. Vb1166]|uniref:hypothetical protein n=1 Tax=Vibrio TaxID=662 RepID=UPI001A90A8C7|nr:MULTISPECIES: hypothetical protein [Vibrio]MBS9921172.1 hypothetical protein [Vibrio alginolyticus]MDW1860640.1 hypothetical protein [Vibrio sp. Vb1166]